MAHRAALVTGASSGIGRALARALAAEGYALTITGRDVKKLDARVEEFKDYRVPVECVAADLRDERAVIDVVVAHCSAYGRMDVLVNSAGDGSGRAMLGDLATEVVDHHLNINLRAMFLTMRHSMPMLIAAGAEHQKALVVNVSSDAAKAGLPQFSPYAAAKAGIKALTQSAASEVGDRGIQFTTFMPGFTATPMAGWVESANISLDELVQPDDLAEALRFLLRTSASCHVPEIEFGPKDRVDIMRRVAEFERAEQA
jgi:ketoreductase